MADPRGGVRLWETETGKLMATWTGGGRGSRESGALSPDGKTLVVSGEGNRAHLLEVATGKKMRLIEGPNKASHLEPGIARIREESLFWFAFAPDGKTVAGMSGKDSLSLWNVADGRLRFTIKSGHGRLIGHNGGAAGALAFSPDGKTLASGGQDTTVLLWDVVRARLEHLWAELAGGQKERAQAGKKLAATPEETIPFLKDRLRRAAVAEERARRFITRCDDDAFEVREKASSDLEGLGPEVAFPLQLALQGAPSVEAGMRFQMVLDKMKTPQGGHAFQPRSITIALAILVEIGTPDARRVLEEVAKGPAHSVVTREARIALERLTKPRKP